MPPLVLTAWLATGRVSVDLGEALLAWLGVGSRNSASSLSPTPEIVMLVVC